ncbi:hypothetical protein C1752_01274 [Acaryochloris thomasi RCC1774]|uniref:Uncharacterized protein n=1 Tax=Acaryochloris thomasi RCC1774 TaxID=1764569 RepID=A0A2W1JMJ2_9CYAN|nr:hypothetical protein C1752_01274 [Acaryochloris thomasi RCC1774]
MTAANYSINGLTGGNIISRNFHLGVEWLSFCLSLQLAFRWHLVFFTCPIFNPVFACWLRNGDTLALLEFWLHTPMDS